MAKHVFHIRSGALLAATLLISSLLPDLSARTEILQLRKARQTKADERWSAPERVTINVHYRVPVIETIGYLAAFYPDNQKLVSLSERVRPIAEQVNELTGESFQGRVFPPEVQEQCNTLHAELFQAVDDIYGAAASKRVQSYLEQKYKSLSSGLFSPIAN